MDWDKISNLYREPSIEASYQVSVHLAKRFQRRRFFLEINQSKTRIVWQPCLLTDRDEMSNHNSGLSIDASYQVSVHLAKRFQSRRIFGKFYMQSALFKKIIPCPFSVLDKTLSIQILLIFLNLLWNRLAK
jgi:hypothetical protein